MKKTAPTTELVSSAQGPLTTDDATLDRLVLDLANLKRTASLDMANAVGKLIIDGLYGGDVSAWRSRGAKDTSFRKLAQRDDLPFGPSTLFQSVAVYELVQRLGLTSPQHLGLSHLRLVLGLPANQQQRLLARAEDEGWSLPKLESEAQKHRRDSRGGGRPFIPVLLKALHGWTRTAIGDGSFEERLGDVDALKPDELVEARETVAEMQRQLAALAARLEAREAPAAVPQQPEAQPAVEGRPEPVAKARRKRA